MTRESTRWNGESLLREKQKRRIEVLCAREMAKRMSSSARETERELWRCFRVESDAMQSETERETAPYMETGTHESGRVDINLMGFTFYG